MGASSSRLEEDKALQLCSERKKFVKQALDGRCSLAASHVIYIQSLRNVGTAIRKFVKPEAPMESSLCTSTSATPEPLGLVEKSPSQFLFSSPTISQPVDVAETFSPSPSPPYSGQFQTNHMKFGGSFSKKVEVKPSLPVMGTVTSSSTRHDNTRSGEIRETSSSEAEPMPHGNAPWDYFSLSESRENPISVQEGGRLNQQLENADDIRRLREEEGIPEMEEEDDSMSLSSRQESDETEDEFDEPSADTLVRSFENRNTSSDHVQGGSSLPRDSAKSLASETELLSHKNRNCPLSSPLQATGSSVSLPIATNRPPAKDASDNKVAPEEFFSSMKYVEYLFIKASESGKEVPRMLEANKLHFRPIVPGREGGSAASTIFKACFSCGEDPSNVSEEPAQDSIKYLTWHRTTSSRSSSSRNPLNSNSKDDMEDLHSDLFENFCMISGSHASTLDRLYAWERKLYDEVKGSKMVRRKYDVECKILRQLESKGQSSYKIDKTRAIVKDLHSRIRVAIHRIDHISKKIEELRDKELQPQLEELIKGLSEMWKEMSKYHHLQYNAISMIHGKCNLAAPRDSESHRLITVLLENDLNTLSSSFTKWIDAQKSYMQAINGWLLKCVSLPQKSSKRKSRAQSTSWRTYGPPIYITCGVWLERLAQLRTKEVADSAKGLASATSHFLPRHEKGHGKNLDHQPDPDSAAVHMNLEDLEDQELGFERFESSLMIFLGQLYSFSKCSETMYEDLEKETEKAKNNYEQWINHLKGQS